MVEVQRFEVTGAGDLASVLAVLTEGLGLRVDHDDEGERRWLDTADGAVRAAGAVLDHRLLADGRAVLVWSQDGRVTARIDDVPREAPTSADGSGLPQRVVAVLGSAALLASAPVRSRVVTLARTDDDDKTVTRCVVDAVTDDSGASSILLTVQPLRGYESETVDLLGRLRDRIALEPASFDHALRPHGAGTGAVSRLRPDLPAVEGWRLELQRLTQVMIDRFSGVLAGEDPEQLHDFRVAVRRIRTLLRDGDEVLEPTGRDRFRTEFAWLGDVTTPARDADVHVLDHPVHVESLPPERRADLDPLLVVLRDERTRAHVRLVADLRSVRRAEFGMAWADWLADDRRWTTDVAERSGDALARVAADRIVAAHDRLVEHGRAVRTSSPPIVLHDLRKEAKRLRYLLECFAPVFDPEPVASITDRLRRLQDVLGEFQDCEVQARALHELLLVRDEDSAMVLAAGSVVEQLGRRSARARKGFAKAFGKFDDRVVRRSLRELQKSARRRKSGGQGR